MRRYRFLELENLPLFLLNLPRGRTLISTFLQHTILFHLEFSEILLRSPRVLDSLGRGWRVAVWGVEGGLNVDLGPLQPYSF